MGYIKVLSILFLFILTVTFSASNSQFVTLILYPFPLKVDAPLFILMLASFIFVVLFSEIKSFLSSMKVKRDIYMDKRKIKALENEIEGFKVDEKIRASI